MTIIELEPVEFYCTVCDSAMEWTGCGAMFCDGYRCLNCQHGCDIHDDNGRCVMDIQTTPVELANELRDQRYPRARRAGRMPGECS